jgi:hypothetical protein
MYTFDKHLHMQYANMLPRVQQKSFLRRLKPSNMKVLLAFYSYMLCSSVVCIFYKMSIGIRLILLKATWKMGSLYYFLIPAFCLALARFIDTTQLLSPATSKFVYLDLAAIPLILSIDSAYAVIELLVPVMGRSGPVVGGILDYF